MTRSEKKSGTRVLHRSIAHRYPVAASGAGILIRDETGKDYIDASAGAAVSCVGHSHPDVLAAMREQMDSLEYAHTSFFTTRAAEALADDLVAHAPDGLDHVFYVSGGSEAIEAALKLARQYFVERGEPNRRHVIARRQSYHGVTLGALAVGGRAWQRQKFAPLLIETHHVAPVYEYRDRAPQETAQAYGERLARELEAKIAELGAENVIAFVAEPVVGATLGAVPAVPGYFQAVRAICDRFGILLILDEVMCGMGRTGTLHACEQEAVAPDLMAIAKGLGGGYQPIGAVMVGARVIDAIAAGSGFFQHGHTYIGHPVACSAALAVQDVLVRDSLVHRCAVQGEKLRARLGQKFGVHPHIGDIRGRGLFLALELVRDRAAKQPFDPALKLHARIKRAALDAGLMCYPMGGTLDGVRGDHVLLAPPFIVSDAELDLVVERLGKAVDTAIAQTA